MPSIMLGNPVASGPQIVVSGNAFSGATPPPLIGGVMMKLPNTASGNVYVSAYSGVTMNSGGFFLSGGGLFDGYLIQPGQEYFLPKSKFPISGILNVYVWADGACSGQSRFYYEVR